MSEAIATFRIELPAGNRAGAFDLVLSQPWAILEADLQTIAKIAARENDQAEFEAILEKSGKPMLYTRDVTIRDRSAIVPIQGPIFRRANMFTRFSGATALETIATDIRTAVDNTAVDQIVLQFSSPGGQAESIAELADRIREMSKQKTIIAYADGYMTSAAYWLGAAANEVIVSKTAILGSIGTVLTLMRNSKDPNIIEIVSSQSPRKRLDPTSDEGRKAYQELADKMTDVFIDSVAYLRRVDRDTVLGKFGQGGLFVGAEAVTAGLADRVGSIEEILTFKTSTSGGISMSGNDKTVAITAINLAFLSANCPDLLAQIRQDAQTEALKGQDAKVQDARNAGATAERDRIKAVKAAALPGHDALIEQLMFDGQTTGEQAAAKVVAAEKGKTTSVRKDQEAEAPAPHQRETITEGEGAVKGKTKAELEAMPLKDRCKLEFEADAKIRDEYQTVEAYTAYKQAVESGQVKARTPAVS